MTKEEIEKQQAAVAAMKGAKAHMDVVLKRVEALEYALNSAKSSLANLKHYTGAYCDIAAHGSGSPMKVHTYIDTAVAEANKALGR